MIQMIPARLEDGRIVQESQLPAADDVRSVSILVELAERQEAEPRESTLPRVAGILKGYDVTGEEYHEHLERKYR